MAGPVRIGFVADTAAAESKIGKFSSRMRTGLRNVGVGALVAGGAAIKFGADAVQSASNAQQSIGATETVFGKYADTVIRRSNQADTALGLSANEYRELANSTGAMLQSAGTPLSKVADLTGRLNQRGADMAATFGGTTREAVEAIGSLLRGETDPIERYGVSIRESDISARLAAKGLDGLTGSALKQAQQQERLALLFEQTGRTAGQFGRESNTLAGQQQRFAASFENLKASLGTALLPVITTVMTKLNAAIPTLQRWGSQLRGFLAPAASAIGTAFRALSSALAPVIGYLRANPAILKGVAVGLGIAAAAAGLFAIAMGAIAIATSPITLVVVAIAAIGGAIALAYKRSAAFRAVVASVGGALRQFGGFVVSTVLPAVRTLAGQIGSRLRPILTTIGNVFRTQILPTITRAIAKFREMSPTLSRAASIIGKVIGFALRLGASFAGKVIPVIVRFAGFVFSKVVPAGVAFIGNIAKAVVGVYNFGKAIVDGVRKLAQFAGAVRDKIAAGIRVIAGLPGRIKAGLGSMLTLLFQAGRDVIAGFVNGVKNAAGNAIDAVKGVASDIGSAAMSALGISSPSRLFKWIADMTIRGFVVNMRSGRRRVGLATARVMDRATGAARAGMDSLNGLVGTGLARVERRTGTVRVLTRAERPTRSAFEDHRGAGRGRGGDTHVIELVFPRTTQAERGGRYAADISAFKNKGGRVMVRPA